MDAGCWKDEGRRRVFIFVVLKLFSIGRGLEVVLGFGWAKRVNSASSSSAADRRARKLNFVSKNREKIS